MLNMKKGLAIVLAAATVFTFAPVASLSNGVEALASTDFKNAQNVQVTVGEKFTYSIAIPNVAENTTYKATNSDKTKASAKFGDSATEITADSTNIPNNSVITVEGLAAGSTTLHIEYYESNKVWQSKDITFTVVNKSNEPVWKINNVAISSYGYPATNTANDTTLNLPKDAPDGTVWVYDANAVTSSDEGVVKVTTNNTSTTGSASDTTAMLQLIKKGSATLTIKAKVSVAGATGLTVGTEKTFSVVVNVIANGSNLTVGDSKNIAATSGRTPKYSTSWSNVDKTVYLTASNPSVAIGATLTDPQSTTEKLVYKAYKENSATVASFNSADETTEILVSSDGTITATANALNSSEQYYFVKVSNNLSDAIEKAGWVRVITSRAEKAFTNLKVDIDGKSKTAAAKFDAVGAVVDDADQAIDINMSTADKTSVPYTVTSSNSYEVKSNDASTVDVVNGTLVAKRVGVASVTVSTKPDTTHYGSAKVTIRVNVTNQKLNAKVVAADSAVTLNKVTKSKKLAASVVTTPALAKQPALSFRFVTKKADGTYEKATPADFDLSADGTVTYKTTAEASAIVEISTPATNDYATPAPAYVTVTGTQKQQPTKLSVATKSLNLEEGATDAIAATGTALSFKSSDEKVATVDATGKVTGVKEGVAVITVSDAGNDEFAAGSADVTVYVTAKAVVKPAKVTGVKVTNVKGAKVKVTWTKSSNANVKYYVKKTVNGKSAGKSVGSNSTTLSVKKGATVKVKVKAYVYDASGKKLVGTYSKTVTKKTDKK